MTTRQITAKEYRIWVRQNYNTEDYTIREREAPNAKGEHVGYWLEVFHGTDYALDTLVATRYVLNAGGGSYFLHTN